MLGKDGVVRAWSWRTPGCFSVAARMHGFFDGFELLFEQFEFTISR